MRSISKNALIGYPAGIITGVTYGLNPLFAVPLMRNGASVESILFFRYGIAVLILGAILLLDRQSFKVTWRQAGRPGCCQCWEYCILAAVFFYLRLTGSSRPDWPRRWCSYIRFLWH